MRGLRYKHWIGIFFAVAVLILAQVAWWAHVFVDEVRTIADLRLRNLELQSASVSLASVASIEHEAWRRKVMFLSESAFFVFMTCVGLCVLYRALRVERRSREIQRNFIEIVTHESKTPITAMKLRLESILEKWAKEPSLNRELSLALDEVRRLASVFEKTLSLNRFEREGLSFENVALDEMVDDVVRRLDYFLRAKNVEMELALERDTYVYGDAAGLRNTIQSLLENAVLYNPNPKRSVKIKVEGLTNSVRLSVSDDGPGVAEKDRQRIFERFYRGLTGRGVAGTGLGLYLARTIVEAHRGQLRLAESSGRGTLFEAEFPCV